MTSHIEIMEWLVRDPSNVNRFIKAIDKIVMGRVVIIAGDDNCLITGFMASKKNRRVRR